MTLTRRKMALEVNKLYSLIDAIKVELVNKATTAKVELLLKKKMIVYIKWRLRLLC